MNARIDSNVPARPGNVVYLPNGATQAARPARGAAVMQAARSLNISGAVRATGRAGGRAVVAMLWAALMTLRMAGGALFILTEPLMRWVCCGLATIMFFTTILLGFIIELPRFPAWSMLGASIGLVMIYMVYFLVMSALTGVRFMGRRGYDYDD